MKKLTLKQRQKFNLIVAFLMSDLGDCGLLLEQNETTWIYTLKAIYKNATGIVLSGYTASGYQKIDTIIPAFYTGINDIFRAAMKGDQEFKSFVESKK